MNRERVRRNKETAHSTAKRLRIDAEKMRADIDQLHAQRYARMLRTYSEVLSPRRYEVLRALIAADVILLSAFIFSYLMK